MNELIKRLRDRAAERRKILEKDIVAETMDELANMLQDDKVNLTNLRSNAD